MIYIIGLFILLFALFVIGYFIKKKYFKEMDRLEAWKIDLFSRPIPDEMSKVKQLNMTGQTEELFEKWRNQWDDVVTVKLPDLEEMLFDAEEYIDKYKFKKAKEAQRKIANKLQETETQINKILEELHELIGSEEKNRLEIDGLKELYREAKKTLLTHRHSFGQSEKALEVELDTVSQKFHEYEEKTEQGNYLEAREVVLFIQSKLTTIKKHMDLIPQFLIECQSLIPNQLTEVLEGYKEMLEQGYYLEHIHVETEIKHLEEKLTEILLLIEKSDIDQAEEGIMEVKQRIDILFDLLEKEVHAKHFVMKNEKMAEDLLFSAERENKKLFMEVRDIQESYQITDDDLETLKSLEKELVTIYKRYEILMEKVKQNNIAQSIIGEELNEIKAQLDLIREGQQSFAMKLQALRKDELEARDKIAELTKKMSEAIRLVKKSNVPGLPEDYKYLLEDTKESIQNVKYQLEEKPLNVSALNQYLEIAVLTVDKLVQTTNELIENVVLAERAIQYGNRYRSQYPTVAKGLAEAENAFRRYEYQEAIEQAAAALESIDPEVLKKIKTTV
ncbi:septation ring formation regulator EzrA [Neobacillus sedimentimangrovi]|uniref:Septation ring formation regulator EzrA n=1 Tax=Neobacillus sedimentimangrovi TaxID=2699460 RepID=A0ABS8QJE5_9BACI|nr:septation ring formation regulator EzrA [Neobacillus sedimentimangrovi]MCD4839368.1 septation ring formation regulator EzrA [Neobacillus sedimentimangrovi]